MSTFVLLNDRRIFTAITFSIQLSHTYPAGHVQIHCLKLLGSSALIRFIWFAPQLEVDTERSMGLWSGGALLHKDLLHNSR